MYTFYFILNTHIKHYEKNIKQLKINILIKNIKIKFKYFKKYKNIKNYIFFKIINFIVKINYICIGDAY